MAGTFLPKRQSAESYRQPMPVTENVCYGTSAFPVCPRCGVAVEREFQSYCDRCGQALDWRKFSL